jgi:NAD+-dependent secondary alcohol dehydrogenase Adh1
MKAVRLEEYGRVPTVTDVPDPVLLADDDIIVQVEGAGVCRTDIHAYEGQLRDVFPTPLPFTLGHETAGIIAEAGPRVRGMAVGDKVILHPLITCGVCTACRRGDDMGCSDSAFTGLVVDGGMAQFVRTSQRAAIVLDPSTDTQSIAPLADAGLTAYHAIRRAVGSLTSESVAVVVGCGGLGHLAIQMLRAMTDCAIVAVDPLEAARALALGLGATRVAGEDARQVVEELTNGAGATAVFDFVGEDETPRLSLDLLGRQGSYYIVGYGGTLEVPTLEMVLKEIKVQGNIVGSYQDLRELVRLYERGLLDSRVVSYPLLDAPRAFADLNSGIIRGRAVLVP